MHEEYNIMDLKPRKNPYVKTCKKQVTINLDENVITYFKNLCQTLINLYLCDCMKNNRLPEAVRKQNISFLQNY